jgi:glycosyltransferase involved in cell wall biosynthesis
MTHVCVVIPAYNEAAVIGQVVDEVRTAFEHVVCIDDGSTDGSAAAARAAGAVVLRHPINLGQGAALQTGFEYGLRDPDVSHVVTFDADGQHQVSDAVRMVNRAISMNVDVVLGSRFLREAPDVPRARRALLTAAAAFTRQTSGLRVTDAHNGLRVLSRQALQGMDLRLHGMAHASELLHTIARRRLSYVEEPVSIRYTEYSLAKGQSGINALNIAFDLIMDRVRARP